MSASNSGGWLDFDLLRRLLCFRGLRQGDLQHAVLERRRDLVGVDAIRQVEIALERAVPTLGDVIVLLFFLLLFLLLALDGEAATGETYLDVLFVHSRQFGRNLIGLVGFAEVDRRSGYEPARPGAFKTGERAERP